MIHIVVIEVRQEGEMTFVLIIVEVFSLEM